MVHQQISIEEDFSERMISLFAQVLVLVAFAGPVLVSGKVGGGAGVLGSLLPPDYDKMTAPPHLEGEKAEILVDLEVLGIPRFDEVILDFEKGWKLL